MKIKELDRGALFRIIGDPEKIIYMKIPDPVSEANARVIYDNTEVFITPDTEVEKFSRGKN